MTVTTADDVLAMLRSLRLAFGGSEDDLQTQIAELLRSRRIPFERELVLGPGSRIDFLVNDGIGIEVKIGKPNSGAVQAQVDRYCRFDEIKAMILLVKRNVFRHQAESNGKPVYYIALSKLWGISL